ncbi:SAM-dependent methyltransferase [Aquitalea magnusonii]|jgi:ubiquinone/menaquinone biosynthesis C-methylase UbiE|uniref:SAM-dependent methyltransferase n=1 Tax=Aquitalea magnusonii TaxID=332411 RepID=A0A3G9GGC8_9NEIS|nr:class I SAM-dependent methyltransferase [Aquitalea magnusonii]BBF86525.1 SAM-dependent methyltransferase [Aquitalea magnusonii]
MDTRAIATFDLQSDQYARYRPQYPDMLFRWLQAAVPGHQRAWDCATGTGQAAVQLSRLFARVDACDINHSQLNAAEQAANIIYLECAVEHPPYGDGVFDLITVAQSLHWFDFPRFWPHVERTLKPGGVFAAWGYDWFEVSPQVDDAMRFFRAVIEPFWSSCSQLLWDGYRYVDMPLPAIDTPVYQIDMHWNLEQLLGYLHTWSATKLCVQSLGNHVLNDAHLRLRRGWGDPAEIRRVSMPLHFIAGRKPG